MTWSTDDKQARLAYADLIESIEAAERDFFLNSSCTGRIRPYIPGEFGFGWNDHNVGATLVYFNSGEIARFPMSHAELAHVTDRQDDVVH
jgi:hypothetical protein